MQRYTAEEYGEALKAEETAMAQAMRVGPNHEFIRFYKIRASALRIASRCDEDEITRLSSLLAAKDKALVEAREALKPFAELSDKLLDGMCLGHYITVRREIIAFNGEHDIKPAALRAACKTLATIDAALQEPKGS